MHAAQDPADLAPKPKIAVAEVKYSLRLMLDELRTERAASTFAMEKLDQNEIGKLFKARTARAKPQK
jgi:hypothetical protein